MRGDADEAERLAREAILIAGQTDVLDLHGDALLALAEVLQLDGRPRDALPAVRDALRLYEQKGNLVSARKARGMVAELSGVRSAGKVP